MSAAGYRRGSSLIRDQIDRDMKHPKAPTEHAFSAGLERGRQESDVEIAALRRKIQRHKAHAERLRTSLAYERQRVDSVLMALQEFCDSFHGQGASGKHWSAIIELLRAKRAA